MGYIFVLELAKISDFRAGFSGLTNANYQSNGSDLQGIYSGDARYVA
jgi:hypothetical protein